MYCVSWIISDYLLKILQLSICLFWQLICDTVVPTDEEMLNELLNTEISVDDFDFPDMSSGPLPEENKEIGVIFAEVHSTGKYVSILVYFGW